MENVVGNVEVLGEILKLLKLLKLMKRRFKTAGEDRQEWTRSYQSAIKQRQLNS